MMKMQTSTTEQSIAKFLSTQYPTNLLLKIFRSFDNHKELCQYKDRLDNALAQLSEREQQLIQLHFKDGLKIDAIAIQEGVSYERVRQIMKKSLKKLFYEI